MSGGIVSRRIGARIRLIKQIEGNQVVYAVESEEGGLNGEFEIRLSAGDEASPSSSDTQQK
jgi:hypothetical protein